MIFDRSPETYKAGVMYSGGKLLARIRRTLRLDNRLEEEVSATRKRQRLTMLFVHASADLYGSDIALLQLVSGLDEDRFHSVVVLPYDGPLVPRLREAGAEVVIFPDLPVLRRQHINMKDMLSLAAASCRSIVWLMDFIRQREVGLIHSNTLALTLTGLAAKLAGRPQVCHVHEIVTWPRIIPPLLAT